MGLFDGILGGVIGGEMATLVNGFIVKHGGVQGIVSQLEQQGLGDTVRSWVGTGANQPISPQQVQQAFGSEMIGQLAAKTGLRRRIWRRNSRRITAAAIDHLTPGGVVPKA